MKSLVRDLLEIDDQIRCVGVIDGNEKTLYSKAKDNGQLRIISESNEEMYAYYLNEIRRMEELFDNCLGQMTHLQFVREKTQHFVYFKTDKIIYVICNLIKDFDHLFKLSNNIKLKIEKSDRYPLYRVPSY